MSATMLDRKQHTLVKITNAPDHSEPAWLFIHVLDRHPAVKEIEVRAGDFYVYVDNPADAHAIAAQHDETVVLQEYAHKSKTIHVEIVPMTQAPTTAYFRLSSFLRAEEEMPRTKTVKFRGLPGAHPICAIMDMAEKCFEEAANFDDPLYPGAYVPEDRNPHVVKIEAERDVALVRFSSEEAAANMVSQCDGCYWKNRVVYAECIPNSEMQEEPKTKQTKFFIPKVKPGASKEDVRALFAPYECQDIQMKPGKPFAFVFMIQEAAVQFLNSLENPDGKRHDGWFWVARADQKKNPGKAAATTPGEEYEVTPLSGPLLNDEGSTEATYGIAHLAIDNETKDEASRAPKLTSGSHAWVSQGAPLKPMHGASKFAQQGPDRSGPLAFATGNTPSALKAPSKAASKIRMTGFPRAATKKHVQAFCGGYPVEEIVLDQGVATVTITGQEQAEEAQLILNNNKNHKILGKKVFCVLM